MILAVLDTNVLVSALCLPESLPADLLRRWLARQFVLILSEQILAELLDVLGRPKIVRRFAMTDQKAQAFIQVLRDLAITTPGELTVEVVPDDPKDNHVVACAMEGEAGYIVSGDQHLKEMKEYQSVYILTLHSSKLYCSKHQGKRVATPPLKGWGLLQVSPKDSYRPWYR